VTDTNVFRLSQPGTFADLLTEILRDGRHRCGRRALPAGARPRRPRLGAHPLFLGDFAALGALVEKPRSADPNPLPQGRLHGRLRGGAAGAAWQGTARCAGGRLHRASVLRECRKSAKISRRFGSHPRKSRYSALPGSPCLMSRSISAVIRRANSSGVLPTGSKPRVTRCSFMSGSAIILTTSRWSVVMTSFGVPAGTRDWT